MSREIVPLRPTIEEGRDQSVREMEPDCLAAAEPLCGADGSITPLNASHDHDGAAFSLVLSERSWQARGRPPALRVLASATIGVPPDREAEASMMALSKLLDGERGAFRTRLRSIELCEGAAAEAILLRDSLDLDAHIVTPDGGAVARGHPMAAAGAVLLTRLFARLVSDPTDVAGAGAATIAARGGMGVAVLVERA